MMFIVKGFIVGSRDWLLFKKTVFFNPKDRDQSKKTKALFFTLTYDTKRCSFDAAWKNIGI
jgi:hypothetical protein